MSIKPSRLAQLQEETKADPTLNELKELIISGWPESMSDLPEHLHAYWCFRDEMTITDGLIMKSNRVIVPASMRSETIKRLHEGHQGLTTTLRRARTTVYWPKIQQDIADVINKCSECQIHANKKPRPPERQLSATRPMEVIAVDLLQLNGNYGLVTVDYYSSFITYDALTSACTGSVITALNGTFQKMGATVERILSDNGPCFKSEEFNKFCKELDINHDTSSPYHHQGNGKAERAIQTVKKILKKTKSSVQITLALLAYHDTPISDNLPSPSELHFGRSSRISPALPSQQLIESQKKMLSDKRSHLRPPSDVIKYIPKQPVWYTEDGTAEWKPAVIDQKDDHPNSYWLVNENNRRIRRNVHDIKTRHVPMPQSDPPQPIWPPTPSMVKPINPQPVSIPSPTRQIPRTPDPNPNTNVNIPPDVHGPVRVQEKQQPSAKTPNKHSMTPKQPAPQKVSRSGRTIKSTKNPDFKYQNANYMCHANFE
ncbi:uncharacterized protein K02A2.6-like [Penaeus indicus]|uniref:uncharacterized protein K02A2.6-like n=1 Tax=Penaeus indicus TaxID=29960 RepID=UPI00300D1317